MLPISILRKAYRRMFDEDVQDRFTSNGFLDNGKSTVSVNYEKAWEACIIEVCSKCLSEDLKIASNKREEKMATKIKELREKGIEI